jgi:hypothetical protein
LQGTALRVAEPSFVSSFCSRHAGTVWWLGGAEAQVEWWREESGKTLIGVLGDEWVYLESEETDDRRLRGVMMAWIRRRAWQDRTWRVWRARMVGRTWRRVQDAFDAWEPRDHWEYWYALNWDVPRWSADEVQMVGVYH